MAVSSSDPMIRASMGILPPPSYEAAVERDDENFLTVAAAEHSEGDHAGSAGALHLQKSPGRNVFDMFCGPVAAHATSTSLFQC
ncbi:hypothetical protein [Mesorhizobium sp. M0140]|uniref:hypothetical protein n=1 Tax=Mesorhizobium sp. M0140 TaxID=2956893 RepID=UPI003338EC59